MTQHTDPPADESDNRGWQEGALCAQTDPEAFFPEKGGSTREAKRVCASCEVRAECLQYALEHDQRFGIWGGLSERERRRLKRSGGARPTLLAVNPGAGQEPEVPTPARQERRTGPHRQALAGKTA
jgi:WhiB family transcriptional regulator, redox-sensing transcriptional regulator